MTTSPGSAPAQPPAAEDVPAQGPCPHPDNYFDRTLCAPPCDVMHTRCTECHKPLDACAHHVDRSQPPASEAERVLAETFRKIAAGRREYAEGAPDNQRDVLLTQAAAFDNAAEIASGSDRPLFGLLPSWRWTDGMTSRVEAAQQRLAERDGGRERG